MPPGPTRVWTVVKQNERVILLCNDVVIFDVNYMTNSYRNESECRQRWNVDFEATRFSGGLEDYYSQYTGGMFYSQYTGGMFYSQYTGGMFCSEFAVIVLMLMYFLILGTGKNPPIFENNLQTGRNITYVVFQFLLTLDIAITEIGRSVQLIVEEEHKPEPGFASTLLQLMVDSTVLGRQFKLKTATRNHVQVNDQHFSSSSV